MRFTAHSMRSAVLAIALPAAFAGTAHGQCRYTTDVTLNDFGAATL